jgi:hypothetical protein
VEKTAAESRAANAPPAPATERSDAPTTDQANLRVAQDATRAARVNASALHAMLNNIVAAGEITHLLLVMLLPPAPPSERQPSPSPCRMPTLATTIWTTMTTSPFWTSQRSQPRAPLPNAPRPTGRRRAESARPAEVTAPTHVVSALNREASALNRAMNARLRVQIGRRLAAIDPHAAHRPLETSNRPPVPPARNETVPPANKRRAVGTLAAESKHPVASTASPRGRRVASASGRANPLALSRAAASREPVSRAVANPAGMVVKKAALRARTTALRVTKIVPPAIVRSPSRPRLGLPPPSLQPKSRLPRSPGPTSLPLGRLARNRPPPRPRNSPHRLPTALNPRLPAWA